MKDERFIEIGKKDCAFLDLIFLDRPLSIEQNARGENYFCGFLPLLNFPHLLAHGHWCFLPAISGHSLILSIIPSIFNRSNPMVW